MHVNPHVKRTGWHRPPAPGRPSGRSFGGAVPSGGAGWAGCVAPAAPAGAGRAGCGRLRTAMDRTINGRTLDERRAHRDKLQEYPPEKLKRNRDRAINEAQRKEQKEEADVQARRDKASKREDVNAPLYKVWSMLRPTLRSAFSDECEATLMLGICVVRKRL